MNAIRIRTRLDSDTPHLPELRPLVGRQVEIIVLEVPAAPPLPPGVTPGTGDWDAAKAAADRLSRSSYNWNILAELDAIDIADQQKRGG